MQRGQVVGMKEHEQPLACSLRTRRKCACLQVFFSVAGKAALQVLLYRKPPSSPHSKGLEDIPGSLTEHQ